MQDLQETLSNHRKAAARALVPFYIVLWHHLQALQLVGVPVLE